MTEDGERTNSFLGAAASLLSGLLVWLRVRQAGQNKLIDRMSLLEHEVRQLREELATATSELVSQRKELARMQRVAARLRRKNDRLQSDHSAAVASLQRTQAAMGAMREERDAWAARAKAAVDSELKVRTDIQGSHQGLGLKPR